jgi:hypothetical protein
MKARCTLHQLAICINTQVAINAHQLLAPAQLKQQCSTAT